jgi:hypothetical protein
MMYFGDWGHMMDWGNGQVGWGYGVFGIVMFLLMSTVLVLVIIWLIQQITKKK